MKRTSINPSQWNRQFLFDQGEVTEGATRHLRCSGQVSIVDDADAEMGLRVDHEGDLAGQIKAALANIDQLLKGAGMSRSDIVYLRFFTTDVDGFLENYGIYGEWIAEAGIQPPQSLLGLNRLALPGMMVEIECEAAT
jgi:enamine deaminase RidA (YjgF/YER057c/UK114 family)